MTTINANNQRHAGIWHRTAHALGTLWAKVVALPEAHSAAARREAPPSEYYLFPPY